MSFRCAICGSAEAGPWLRDVPDYEYGVPGKTTLVQCAKCGVVQQDPLPGPADLSVFYPEDYHAYHYADSPVSNWLKKRYSEGVGRQIRDAVSVEGAILDVGCADGSFLAALESLGSWELHGIDLNPEVVREPRSPRLHLRVGQLERGTYAPESFDAIVATHLVEHVCDPLEFVRTCEEILRPGGILIGELPCLDAWDARLFGRHWGGLHLPRHLFFWTQEGFAELGRRGGFAEVEVSPLFQPAHWAISVQNALVDRFPALKQRLRNGRLPFYVPLVLAASPLCWLQNAARKPSIMGFQFRKAHSSSGPDSPRRPGPSPWP